MTRYPLTLAAILLLLLAAFIASGLWVGCNAPQHMNCEGEEP